MKKETVLYWNWLTHKQVLNESTFSGKTPLQLQLLQLSSSWFYHKMDGIDGNGGKGGFTESEALLLRGALIDLSERLRKAADEIK